MSGTKVLDFKPKTANAGGSPNQIPPEIANDPDPRVKELYLEAYGYVRGCKELRDMTSNSRVRWIQGFMNGSLCYRSKFDNMDSREAALKLQLDQMQTMKTYIDETITELEKNYEPKDLSSAQEKVSIKCSTDDVRAEEGTKES